jgi:uncharacterized protein YqeY
MMSIKEQLQTQLKDAMRAGDDLKKSTLRMAISAIRLAEIDKGSELDDNAILAILQKEVKSRQESIEEAQQANRPELAQAAQQEIEVLKAFLPEQLSSEELEAMVKQVIEEIGATSMREMGAVMKALVPRLEGRATGQQANQVVRKLLA